jgi:hypothetical protein
MIFYRFFIFIFIFINNCYANNLINIPEGYRINYYSNSISDTKTSVDFSDYSVVTKNYLYYMQRLFGNKSDNILYKSLFILLIRLIRLDRRRNK